MRVRERPPQAVLRDGLARFRARHCGLAVGPPLLLGYMVDHGHCGPVLEKSHHLDRNRSRRPDPRSAEAERRSRTVRDASGPPAHSRTIASRSGIGPAPVGFDRGCVMSRCHRADSTGMPRSRHRDQRTASPASAAQVARVPQCDRPASGPPQQQPLSPHAIPSRSPGGRHSGDARRTEGYTSLYRSTAASSGPRGRQGWAVLRIMKSRT